MTVSRSTSLSLALIKVRCFYASISPAAYENILAILALDAGCVNAYGEQSQSTRTYLHINDQGENRPLKNQYF